MLRTAERGLGVDHPILPEERAQEGSQDFVLRQRFQSAGQAQIPIAECSLEPGYEFPAEHSAQDSDRKKEGIARMNPALVIWGQAAGRDHAVDMRVMQKVLAPGVKHTEETDLCAEMRRIGGGLQQGGGAGAEQQVIEKLFVMERQRSQLVRQREDHVDVGHGQ